MSINKESKVAVLCGGISQEREVSLRSGKNCFEALQRIGYKNTKLIDIKSFDDIYNLKDNIDVAFLTTHGKFGEDGALQGCLEWLKIPYTGSSITSSAIAMDKWTTKLIAGSIGLNVAKAALITSGNVKSIGIEKIWEQYSKTTGAMFLKPSNDGSSVNTFKIKSLKELKDRVDSIDLSCANYLLEEFIPGREITMSVIEHPLTGYTILPALELKPKNEFYDYEAKYTKGMTEFILPAQIDEDMKIKLEQDTFRLFSQLNCSGFGRIDFILDGKIPYVLEVNSLPGMTDTSDLPAQADCAGIGYDELVEIILKAAKLHK